MGLFSWLFGNSPAVPVTDRIWLTAAAGLRGVLRELEGHHREGRTALLVAHFPATLTAVVAELDARNVAQVPFPRGMTPAQLLRAADGAGPLLLTGLARDLAPDPEPSEPAAGGPVPVVAAERHPVREYDDRVVEFAEGLGGRGRVTFHLSLDDPLLRLFTGSWMRDTLRRLGMKEDEPIESGMVARRVKTAQAKIARLVTGDHDADSADEWLRLNCRVG